MEFTQTQKILAVVVSVVFILVIAVLVFRGKESM